MFKLLGLFSPSMDYIRHISGALNTTPESFAAERSWADLGTPTTISEYACTLPS